MHTAGRVCPKETDYSACFVQLVDMSLDLSDLSNLLFVGFVKFRSPRILVKEVLAELQ